MKTWTDAHQQKALCWWCMFLCPAEHFILTSHFILSTKIWPNKYVIPVVEVNRKFKINPYLLVMYGSYFRGAAFIKDILKTRTIWVKKIINFHKYISPAIFHRKSIKNYLTKKIWNTSFSLCTLGAQTLAVDYYKFEVWPFN